MPNPMQAAAVRRARVGTLAAFFLQGLTLATIVTRIPAFQDKFGVGEGEVTALLLLVAVLAGVGSVLAGAIARRRTSAVALRGALFTIAAAAALIGVAPNRPALYLAFAVYGIGIGAVDAGMNMQGVTVQELYGRSIMTSFHAMWSIAGIIGALYAAGVASLDWGLAPSLGVVAAVGVAVTVAAGPYLVATRAVAEPHAGPAGQDSGQPAGQDGGQPGGPAPTPPAVPWAPIVMIGVAVLAYFIADTGVLSWSSLYLQDALDSSEAIAPLGYGAYQAGAVVSRLAGDQFVRRYGAVPVVRVATVVGVVALAAVVAAPTPWFAIAAFALLGLGLSVVVPLAFAAAGSLDAADSDAAIARVNVFNYAGNIVGGALIGAVATAGSLRWIFVVPLVLVPVVLVVSRAFAPALSVRGPVTGPAPRQ
ncbi:MAG: MFS transporter [Nocardioidaceae bacterium]